MTVDSAATELSTECLAGWYTELTLSQYHASPRGPQDFYYCRWSVHVVHIYV